MVFGGCCNTKKKKGVTSEYEKSSFGVDNSNLWCLFYLVDRSSRVWFATERKL